VLIKPQSELEAALASLDAERVQLTAGMYVLRCLRRL
jgi:hypothetical protein